MHPLTKRFAEYCEDHFDLKHQVPYHYQSLPICVIDCIYSLRAKYEATTLPIVQRYADMFMGGDRNAAGDTITDLIYRIESCGGPREFAERIVKNHQKLGRSSVPKEDAVYQLARYLKLLQIETLEDFRQYESPELLEVVIRAVKGISDAGVNYLFMLAGDPDRVKPDVHIHHSIIDACGRDVSNEECQILFREAVEILNTCHNGLTVAALDNTIWRFYSKASFDSSCIDST